MKRRNLGVMALLSIVTLGIYVLVWLYNTRQELTRQASNPKAVPAYGFLLLPYLAFLVLVLLSVVLNHFTDSSPFNAVLIILNVVAIIGMFVIPLWWFYRYFQTVYQVTRGNDGVLLYVIWIINVLVVFFPVWMLLVQNDLNKAADRLAAEPPQDMPLPGQ